MNLHSNLVFLGYDDPIYIEIKKNNIAIGICDLCDGTFDECNKFDCYGGIYVDVKKIRNVKLNQVFYGKH